MRYLDMGEAIFKLDEYVRVTADYEAAHRLMFVEGLTLEQHNEATIIAGAMKQRRDKLQNELMQRLIGNYAAPTEGPQP